MFCFSMFLGIRLFVYFISINIFYFKLCKLGNEMAVEQRSQWIKRRTMARCTGRGVELEMKNKCNFI